jgi:hypothetical protein
MRASIIGERVGIHDNFFELGGDSILSIQIVAKANRAGIQLTPKLLFQHQAIAFLAVTAGTVEAVRAEQKPVAGAVPLTPVQQWFFEENFAFGHHWNQSVRSWRSKLVTVATALQTLRFPSG